MALFSRVTTWVSNQVLTASALNGEFNNLLTNAKAASYIGFSADTSQMQQQTSPGGVGTESLAGSISDELQRLRYMMAFTTGKTYWYDSTGRNLGTGNMAVLTADIGNLQVTQGKIALLAVANAQMAAGAALANIGAGGITNAYLGAGSVLSAQIGTNVDMAGKATKVAAKNITTSNTNAGTNGLAIIRSSVVAAGGVGTGEGLASATRTGAGTYVINWSTAFGDAPSVVCCINDGTKGFVATASSSTTAVAVSTFDSGGSATDMNFDIIAIGQRA